MKAKDLTVLLGIIGIVLMMILPIPSWLLDVLLVINISIALIIILVAMNTKNALEFSIFPSLCYIYRASPACTGLSKLRYPAGVYNKSRNRQHHDQILYLVSSDHVSKCLITFKTCSMRLSDFIVLDQEEKKLMVLHQGVLIGKRKKTGLIIFLFQLQNFYVETFCDTDTKGVTQYQAFAHTKLLQPYLEEIPIDDLLN